MKTKYIIYSNGVQSKTLAILCEKKGWNINSFMNTKSQAKKKAEAEGLKFNGFFYKGCFIGAK